MSFTNKLRKLKNNFFNATAFPNNISEFRRELESMDIQEMNYVERSFTSYRIKVKYSDLGKVAKVLKKAIYGVGFIILLPYIFSQTRPKQEMDARVIYYKISNNKGIIPKGILKLNPITAKMGIGFFLDDKAKAILKQSVTSSKMCVAFLFEVLFSLANYSYINARYSPEIIVTTYESSPVTSILTKYCRENNILHYNIMHGDKFYSHVNTLGEFDVMYVWDNYYELLFRKLKYDCIKYRLFNPWNDIALPSSNSKHDFTLYLNRETNVSIKKSIEVAENLAKRGYAILVRPHPSQLEEIKEKKLISEDMLENTKDISIFQSLANTRGVISMYSTVLFQASFYGKNIVIDDITDRETFHRLKDVQYIMLNKPHTILSDIIGEKKN